MIQPWKDVTFVVKEKPAEVSFFGPAFIARAHRRRPRNPRKISSRCSGGRRGEGSSKAVPSLFSADAQFRFSNRAYFNTIGVKLAKRRVPVIPVALKTDAWGEREPPQRFCPVDVKRPSTLVWRAHAHRRHGQGRASTDHRVHHPIASAYGDVRLGNDGCETGEGTF